MGFSVWGSGFNVEGSEGELLLWKEKKSLPLHGLSCKHYLLFVTEIVLVDAELICFHSGATKRCSAKVLAGGTPSFKLGHSLRAGATASAIAAILAETDLGRRSDDAGVWLGTRLQRLEMKVRLR